MARPTRPRVLTLLACCTLLRAMRALGGSTEGKTVLQLAKHTNLHRMFVSLLVHYSCMLSIHDQKVTLSIKIYKLKFPTLYGYP